MMQPRLFADIPKKPPDVCRRKHKGNPESEAANLIPDKALWQRKVYDLAQSLGIYGITADEAAAHFNVGHNTVAPRISELQEEGWLFKTKERRKTRSGCWARVLLARPGRPHGERQQS
jgi:hypothetical protein